MLACLYLISQLDRANIGNAKIEGLDKDLGLSGVQYNICNSIFFIPYVLLEVPSNVLLKKFSRPSVYLGILVTLWGIVMTCHGWVKNFPGLLVLRLVLGSLEAGFYPGAVYLCTFWCTCSHSLPSYFVMHMLTTPQTCLRSSPQESPSSTVLVRFQERSLVSWPLV